MNLIGLRVGMMSPSEELSLGLGEFAAGGQDGGNWVIYGLGSCIGLVLADRMQRNAAMAHIVLPSSPTPDAPEPAKYVDTAVPFLLAELRRLGSNERHVVAQMAGGAKMLQLKTMGDIGRRNIERIQQVLSDYRIPIVAECLGGTSGRTLRWDRQQGIATMSQVGREDVILTPNRYRFAAGACGVS